MSNTFKFVGQIKKLEEKGNKKYIETIKLQSGWMIKRVKFRMVCGDTSEILDLSSGKWQDDSKNVVYTVALKQGATAPKDVEQVQIEWKDRMDPDIVAKIPSYKRYSIDMSSNKIRKKMSEDKSVTEAETDKAEGAKSVYISQYDFVQKFEELLLSDAFGNDNYVVSGNVEYTYSQDKDGEGKYYRNFVPTSIYKASDEDVAGAYGKLDFYFLTTEGEGVSVDCGDTVYSGYLKFYERMSKKNYYTPLSIRIKAGSSKEDGLKKVFATSSNLDGDVALIGINVAFFDGAPIVKITYEDLDSDQRWLIDLGVKTLEETISEYAGMVGERVNYVYVAGIARGCSVPTLAEVTEEELNAKPDTEDKKNSQQTTSVTAKSNMSTNIFDLDDDDI